MYLQYGRTAHAAGFTARLVDMASRLVTRLATRLASFSKAVEGHRAARRLEALDDRILDDIGLSRADVSRAVYSPLLEDPRQDLALARHFRITGRNRPLRRRR